MSDPTYTGSSIIKPAGKKGELDKNVLQGKNYQPLVYMELASGNENLRGLASSGVRFLTLEGENTDPDYSPQRHTASFPPFGEKLSQLVFR